MFGQVQKNRQNEGSSRTIFLLYLYYHDMILQIQREHRIFQESANPDSGSKVHFYMTTLKIDEWI